MSAIRTADLAAWSGGRWLGAPAEAVGSVCHDSRRIDRGCLYVAIRGAKFDGHDFVAEAFAKGAAGAMVNDDWTGGGTGVGPLLVVDETVVALGRLGTGHRRKVGAKIVAVTGSAGKSTVKEMTAQLLAGRFRTAWTKGNWNNEIGLPLSLLAMDDGTRMGVFETGTNHPGEIEGLCRVLEPDWGIVTNIGQVHIENFGTLEEIAKEKGRLPACLPAGGVAFLSKEEGFYEYLRSLCACRVITTSMRDAGDYNCLNRDFTAREMLVEEKATGERYLLKSPLPGEHNVRNALLAVAVARTAGLEWSAIGEALEGYKHLPMRWEESEVAERTIINDAYNANPLSMKASLATFAARQGRGCRWVVLSGMLELGDSEREEHVALGELVARGPWRGLITVGPLGDLIAEGAEAGGMDSASVSRCATAVDAARAILGRTAPGDTILLKASRGMHLEEVVECLKTEAGR